MYYALSIYLYKKNVNSQKAFVFAGNLIKNMVEYNP